MKTKTISSSALHCRINRALAHHRQILRKCREGSRYHHERGDYYCVDIQTTGISETHVDLMDLARELQVLQKSELLSEQEEDTVTAKDNDTVSEKEFLAMTRQMQRELRVMQRRINELIKKHKATTLKRKAATRKFGTRLSTRTKRVAAKSIAAIPAESIPFIGVAVLFADTGYELYSACETVRDLDQLHSDLGMADETQDDVMHSVCVPELPVLWAP